MLARGSGSGLPLLVAQVFNLCVFPVRIGLAASSLACAIPEGGAAGSEALAEAGETCASLLVVVSLIVALVANHAQFTPERTKVAAMFWHTPAYATGMAAIGIACAAVGRDASITFAAAPAQASAIPSDYPQHPKPSFPRDLGP